MTVLHSYHLVMIVDAPSTAGVLRALEELRDELVGAVRSRNAAIRLAAAGVEAAPFAFGQTEMAMSRVATAQAGVDRCHAAFEMGVSVAKATRRMARAEIDEWLETAFTVEMLARR